MFKFLRKTEDERVVDFFLKLIIEEEDNDDLQIAAARGLAVLGDISVTKVGQLLDEEDGFKRMLAAKILSRINTTKSKQLLEKALNDPEAPVRFAAGKPWEFWD